MERHKDTLSPFLTNPTSDGTPANNNIHKLVIRAANFNNTIDEGRILREDAHYKRLVTLINEHVKQGTTFNINIIAPRVNSK